MCASCDLTYVFYFTFNNKSFIYLSIYRLACWCQNYVIWILVLRNKKVSSVYCNVNHFTLMLMKPTFFIFYPRANQIYVPPFNPRANQMYVYFLSSCKPNRYLPLWPHANQTLVHFFDPLAKQTYFYSFNSLQTTPMFVFWPLYKANLCLPLCLSRKPNQFVILYSRSTKPESDLLLSWNHSYIYHSYIYHSYPREN